MASPTVSLEPATAADAVLLANLLELYVHDLSEVFPNIEIGADGRYGYPKLPLYWSEPERRFAFLIRMDRRISGFALVTRGSPAVEDPSVLDVAEFFVLRGDRRYGIGRQAAFLLWSRLRGTWTVRVLEANRGGLAFWSNTVAQYTDGAASEFTWGGQANPWRVFSFQSAADFVNG